MKIYLIQLNINNEVFYKIGKTTKNTNDRISSFMTGNPGKFTILYEYETKNTNQLEKALHRYYSHRNMKNEWFFDIDLEDFKKTIQILDRALNFVS